MLSCLLYFLLTISILSKDNLTFAEKASTSIKNSDNADLQSKFVQYLELRQLVNYVSAADTIACRKVKPYSTYLQDSFPILRTIITENFWTETFKPQLKFAITHAGYLGEYFLEKNSRDDLPTLIDITKALEPTFEGLGICDIATTQAIHSSIRDNSFLSSLCDQIKSLHFMSPDSKDPDIERPYAWSTPSCDTPEKNFNTFPLRIFVQIRQTLYVFFDLDIRNATLNQCQLNLDLCHPTTTKCHFQSTEGHAKFSLGNYKCVCREGFYHKQFGQLGFDGSRIEEQYVNHLKGNMEQGSTIDQGKYLSEVMLSQSSDNDDDGNSLTCKMCHPACVSCNATHTCSLEKENTWIRYVPLGIHIVCCFICLCLAILITKKRKNRVLKSSNWIMVEIFLLGAILIYIQGAIKYFPPTTLICVILPWFRQLGFSTLYGTLLVKIYRVLCGFQSRKAPRVHMGERDMLRLLASFVFVALMYVIAYTAANLDHFYGPNESQLMEPSMIAAQHNIRHMVCRVMYAEGFTEILEFLLAILALYYCRCVWAAPSEYYENRCITLIFAIELIFSALTRITKHFVYYRLHPDTIYFIEFCHTHLTVTVAVSLFIGPKLWFVYRPPPPVAGRGRLVSNKMGLPSNGDLDIGDVNLADMDPEDIRRELRKLYNNIEAYRAKISRKSNPQQSASKRKAGRKQRRFSLQPFSHKKHQLSTASGIHEEEVSKMSEDSGEEEAPNVTPRT
jgi:G protein-coupled receptor 158